MSAAGRSAVPWLFGAVVAGTAVSAFAGVDVARSLAGSPAGRPGVVAVAAIAAACLVAMRTLRGWGAWRLPLGTLTVAGGLVSSGIAFGLLRDADLGAFAIVTLFVGWLVRSRSTSRGMRIIAAAAVAAALAAAIASRAAAPLAAAGVGAALVCAVHRDEAPTGSTARRLAVAGLVAGLILPVAAWAALQRPAEDGPPPVRIAGLDVARPTLAARGLVGNAALDAALERPILGWGPANFEFAHDTAYRPELLRFAPQMTHPDGAGSALLDALVERGVVGALPWAAMFVVPFVALLRAQRRGAVDAATAASATGLLAALFVRGLLASEGIVATAGLFLAGTLIVGLSADDRASSADPRPSRRAGRAAAVVVGVAAAAWCVRSLPAWDESAPRDAAAAEAALRGHPLDVRAALDLATTSMASGGADRLAAAETTLRAAIARAPLRQDVRFALADVLLAEHRTEEAFDVADDAWRDDVLAGEAALRFARFCLRAGDPDAARRVLEIAAQAGANLSEEALRLRRDAPTDGR